MHQLTFYVGIITYMEQTSSLFHWNDITYLSTGAVFITMVTWTQDSCIFQVHY